METNRSSFSVLSIAGLPLESLLPNQRCRCRKQSPDVIPAGKISSIEVIPRGIQCRRKEIITLHPYNPPQQRVGQGLGTKFQSNAVSKCVSSESGDVFKHL
uniref:Chemokine interleukin-8-like domain-containing protein n=1 Tax=Pelusios castaneus TaxID=367368 RepID=A0A8C8RLJ8_9SAUR